MERVDRTYFKSLPTECVQNVLERCNGLTNDAKPSLFFSEASPLCAATPSLFTTLHVFTSDSNIRVEPGVIIIGCVSEAELDSEWIRRALEVCGSSIKSLIVNMTYFFMKGRRISKKLWRKLRVKLVWRLLQYCKNVTCIEFEGAFSETPIREFTSRLTTAISDLNTCAHAKPANSRSAIKQLKFSYGTYRSLSWLLAAFGDSLEMLRIDNIMCSNDEIHEMLDFIETRVKRLHTFIATDAWRIVEKVGQARYVRLLCSYGDKLVSANLSGLDPDSIFEVIRNCTSLDIKTPFILDSITPEQAQRIGEIGTRWNSMFVYGTTPQYEWGVNPFIQCNNLRELRIYCSDFFRLLPALPLLEILEFELDNVSLDDTCAIGCKTSNLKQFRAGLWCPIEDADVFRPIIDSNNFLRRVRIDEYWIRDQDDDDREDYVERSYHLSLRVLIQLVNLFSSCQTLRFTLEGLRSKEFNVNDLRKCCAVLPCRGVKIEIHRARDFHDMADSVLYKQSGELL